MDTLATLLDTLFIRLAWTTAQATVLIGALWLLGRCIPLLAPAMRCMLWWLVAAQLLLGVAVSSPIPLPWLKQAVAVAPSAHVVVLRPETDAAGNLDTAMPIASEHHTSSAIDLLIASWTWRDALLILWLAVLTIQLYIVLGQWHQRRKLLREAKPLEDESLRRLCVQQARALGLRFCPQLLLSDAIRSPQVTGMWRPAILFPSAHSLTDEESAMALAHELAHIRRGDLWLGWVPAIAQRLFFFHPMVHWAIREYALNREAACDAHVLKQPQLEPRDYGRLLLRLGVSSPMHSSLAGASPTFTNLKRRMIMLQQTSVTPSRARGWLWVIAVALVGILPYRLTTADPVQSAASQTNDGAVFAPVPPPPPPAAPANASPATPAVSAVPATPAVPAAPAVPPPPPPPPPAPAAPAQAAIPPQPPIPLSYSARHMDIDITSNAKHGFVLFDGDTLIVDGSDADSHAALRYYKPPVPMLWYRNGGQSYVIHDSGFIQQARDNYNAVTDVAREQGELAGRQASLAGEQSGLAAREAALAGRQAEMESRRAALTAKYEALHNAQAMSEEKNADALSLNGQLKGMDAEAAEIAREYAHIHSDQAALAQRQKAMAHEMDIMNTRQRDTADRVNAQMSRLLEKAKEKGLAEPVNR